MTPHDLQLIRVIAWKRQITHFDRIFLSTICISRTRVSSISFGIKFQTHFSLQFLYIEEGRIFEESCRAIKYDK